MNNLEILQTLLLLMILILILFKEYLRKPPRQSSDQTLVDSSVLIDGRILEIAASGFIPSRLIVPRFIVAELQLLADGSDSLKRDRARFGLDVIKELQNNLGNRIDIGSDQEISESMLTDTKLVTLAKKLNCTLCTNDYNLNKVATIEGIKVLNVNELAKSLRPVALPGEKIHVKLIQKGSNRDQGVGYLDNGSMVVVSGGSGSIGKTVEVEIARYLQTDAGKMLFGRLVGQQNSTAAKKRSRSSHSR